ncbi:MAG: hypothetical protein U1E62_05455 [Alsobacter sp.]
MVGLLDLAPSKTKVHGVAVTGISAEGLVSIVKRFPELERLLGGATAAGFGARDILALTPQAIKAVIAAGVGYPDDAKQEAKAGTLPLEIQADFLEAIIKATLPSGVGPFVERIMALAKASDSITSPTTAPSPNGQTKPAVGKKPTAPKIDPTKLSGDARKEFLASSKARAGESRPLKPGK